jgi:HD-GYP domain-containing protein (c-di-GMP phosphodiesterase class II)
VDRTITLLVVSMLLLNFVVLPLLGLRLRSRRRMAAEARERAWLHVPTIDSMGPRGRGPHTDGYASVLLSRLVVQTCRVMAVDRACLLVADARDPRQMVAVVAHGLDEDVIGESVTVHGPLQAALRSGKAQRVDARGLLPAFGAGSIVAMPADAAARRLILCVAAEDRELDPDERDLALLGWLAGLCAAAVGDLEIKDRLDSHLRVCTDELTAVCDFEDRIGPGSRVDAARLATHLGTRLALDPAALIELEIAARVSQLGMPDAAGQRSGAMTSSRHGSILELAERLAQVSGFEVVALIARFIPERWDGLGPQGLSGTRIPLASRILAACNAIRVLAGNRADDGIAVEIAVRRVQSASASIFDPTVVTALTHELVGDMPELADDTTTAADWARADAQYAGVR